MTNRCCCSDAPQALSVYRQAYAAKVKAQKAEVKAQKGARANDATQAPDAAAATQAERGVADVAAGVDKVRSLHPFELEWMRSVHASQVVSP